MLFPHRARLALFAIMALTACKRTDPLLAFPNEAGTAVLQDIAVGSDTRIICVTPSLHESCDKRSAEVVVENVRDSGDIRSEWVTNNAVRVTIGSGVVRRFEVHSRDGKVALQTALPGI